ncbi:MAG: T9SS type A sorting domain-containing protein, partial [Bacteroidia bacterium]|nr:T9SS type A sorting domain-containing protein [Bacteroidia bacterium]
GPFNHTPFVGWNTHTFSTPFYWDGTSNIIIETCFNNTSYTVNSPVYVTNMGYNCSVYLYQDATGVCTNNTVYGTSTSRPNMRFRHCTTPPASTYYNYSWSPSTGLSCTTCEDPTANPSSTPITYTITVTDAYGCTATASTTILPCLPTTLFLQGSSQGQNAVLSWDYPNDLSFKYFELERSNDGTNYQSIAKFSPVSGQDKYQYTDEGLRARNYYYRVRKVNKDGSEAYSNTVEITINSVLDGFTVQNIAPNPAFDEVMIQYALSTAGKVQFAIYDLTGRKLKDIHEGNLTTGQYVQKFSVADLANGNYLIVAIFNNHTQHFRLNVAR